MMSKSNSSSVQATLLIRGNHGLVKGLVDVHFYAQFQTHSRSSASLTSFCLCQWPSPLTNKGGPLSPHQSSSSVSKYGDHCSDLIKRDLLVFIHLLLGFIDIHIVVLYMGFFHFFQSFFLWFKMSFRFSTPVFHRWPFETFQAKTGSHCCTQAIF